ncbi:uncharacterized protein AAES06_017876 isoform 2-T3 [Glossophaga mutica]
MSRASPPGPPPQLHPLQLCCPDLTPEPLGPPDGPPLSLLESPARVPPAGRHPPLVPPWNRLCALQVPPGFLPAAPAPCRVSAGAPTGRKSLLKLLTEVRAPIMCLEDTRRPEHPWVKPHALLSSWPSQSPHRTPVRQPAESSRAAQPPALAPPPAAQHAAPSPATPPPHLSPSIQPRRGTRPHSAAGAPGFPFPLPFLACPPAQASVHAPRQLPPTSPPHPWPRPDFDQMSKFLGGTAPRSPAHRHPTCSGTPTKSCPHPNVLPADKGQCGGQMESPGDIRIPMSKLPFLVPVAVPLVPFSTSLSKFKSVPSTGTPPLRGPPASVGGLWSVRFPVLLERPS